MTHCTSTPLDGLDFWLEKLEELIDLDHVVRTSDLQRRCFAFEPVEHIPTVIDYPVGEEWPEFGFEDIYHDPAKMLLSELRSVYTGAKLQDDRLYGIRANYGTGIIASMFGCEVVVLDHSLPRALPVSEERLREVLAGDLPPVRAGIVGRALDTVAFYRETLAPYPKLSTAVGSQMLDIQGPFDNAMLIWGEGALYAIYDEYQNLAQLMDLVVEATLAVVREHRRIDGRPIEEHDGWWNGLGGLCVREDSCVMLSGAQYRDFVKPHDAKLLSQLGGWLHWCGKGHQWLDEVLSLPGVRGVNISQGEFYDLAQVYQACEAAKVAIVGWAQPVPEYLRGRIRTGFSRAACAADYDAACRMKERLYETGHVDVDSPIGLSNRPKA
ncbi:MAG: uroporphyrinogen decarboxylase family protein [Armatimonadetes bacterium]|nr:uroporphyrinogen decarboxylase family protein [Armatimonadota bacterium]